MCPDAQDGFKLERQPFLVCLVVSVVVKSRGAFDVVLVKCSSEVDIMCIHQHHSSSACGSPVGRSTGCVHLNVNSVSLRQVRYDMAGVTEAKHSCASSGLRLHRRR